ncbi:MAG: maltose/glucose-specific PTS transporter subunit IIBC [Brevinema sp.]
MSQKLWDFFQNFGKSLMLPVALLAAMGILLGIGSSLSSGSVIETLPFLAWAPLQIIFKFMTTIGLFAFINLPILFSMAIPIGLARTEKGIAAFSGYVGFIVLNLSINFFLKETGTLASTELRDAGQTIILGIQSIDTGVLGGVFVGIIVATLHNKFHNVVFPDAFAFFGGARFVPIITAFTLAVTGLFVPLIWPFFDNMIRGIGLFIKYSGVFGPFVFIAGERLLLPFGLHHILVAAVRFTSIGGETVINGETVAGALNIYYAQLGQSLPFSGEATRFLSQAKMPFMMFGLPGAAIAMLHTSYPSNKKIVKGLLISGAISAAVAGISEPIEFLFLFIAPLLYLFHVIMSGLGALVLGMLGVLIGNTDGNIIDFLIFGVLQGTQTKWYHVLWVGSIWFATYYFVFRYTIQKFNLKTPGREEISNNSDQTTLKNYAAEKMLQGLGGTDNIVSLDNCITRLRITLKDIQLLDEETIKEAGALNIVRLDNKNIQVIIGPQVHVIKNQLDKIRGIG